PGRSGPGRPVMSRRLAVEDAVGDAADDESAEDAGGDVAAAAAASAAAPAAAAPAAPVVVAVQASGVDVALGELQGLGRELRDPARGGQGLLAGVLRLDHLGDVDA